MSYLSCNGVGSYTSGTATDLLTTGATIPVGAITSGTEYNLFEWDIDSSNGNNGIGTYFFSVNFDVTGTATTVFTQLSVNFNDIWINNVLVRTTLPNTNDQTFSMAFPYVASGATNVIIKITGAFTGPAPTISNYYTSVYKVC
jgi:hypothetical protein